MVVTFSVCLLPGGWGIWKYCLYIPTGIQVIRKYGSNYQPITVSKPVPLPDLHFDLFSYPLPSIVFSDIAIVPLFLLLFF